MLGWPNSNFRTEMQITDSIYERSGQSEAFMICKTFIMVFRQGFKQNKGFMKRDWANPVGQQ